MLPISFDNPWIIAAEIGRGGRRAGVILIGGALLAAAILLSMRWVSPTMAHLAGVDTGSPAAWPTILDRILVIAILFGALLAVASAGTLAERRSFWRTPSRPALAVLAGLAVGAAGFSICVGLAFLAGAVTSGATPAFAAGAGATVIGLGLVLFQASVEEVYFRGWLQPLSCLKLGPWLGLAVTSALFAALHVVAGVRGPLAVLNLFLGGLMFGLLALRSGGLWAPAAAHFGWNWTESGLLGLDPNPGVGPTGSLIDLDLKGPALWSGGTETLNGSLASTIVLIAIVVGLVILGPNRRTQPV